VQELGICIGCYVDNEIEYSIIMELKGVNHRMIVVYSQLLYLVKPSGQLNFATFLMLLTL